MKALCLYNWFQRKFPKSGLAFGLGIAVLSQSALGFEPGDLSYFVPERSNIGSSLGPSCDPGRLPPAVPVNPNLPPDEWKAITFNLENSFLKVPRSFLKGVCLFHLSFEKFSPEAKDQANIDRMREESVQALSASQTIGLGLAQQGLANLYEGLLHCQRALQLKNKPKDNKNFYLDEEMCIERKMSFANFKSIDWHSLEMDYTAGESIETFGLNALIDKMGQCYNDLYNTAINVDCLQSPQISAEDETRIIEGVSKNVVDKYFGVSSSSVGIIARKVNEASQAAKEFEAILDDGKCGGGADEVSCLTEGLVSRVADANSNVNEIKKSLDGADFKASIATASEAYKQANLEARTILAEFNSWMRGLTSASDGTSPLTHLRSYNVKLETERDNLKKAVTISDSNAAPRSLQSFKAGIQSLLSRDADSRVELKKLCKIYTCGILNERNLADLVGKCKESGNPNPNKNLDANPLCVEGSPKDYRFRADGRIMGDGASLSATTVQAVCQQFEGLTPNPNAPVVFAKGRSCMNL